MILFGYLVASVLQTEANWPFTTTWLVFMIAAALIIAFLNYRGVRLSAKTGTVLGTLEIIVFLVLAIWLIVKAGSGNAGNVFSLHFATIKGYHGFSGVIAGSIYTILAFIGFEASAPLAGTTRARPAVSSTGCCTRSSRCSASWRSFPPGSPRWASAARC
jgi:amino acid transporter